jgi:hypothetical protein
MNADAKTIEEIQSLDRPIQDWTREELPELAMLFWQKMPSLDASEEETRLGFRFCVLDWCWSNTDGTNNHYQVMCEGYGYFDGVRHMYFSPQSQGYDNYPDLSLWITVLSRLRELELQNCWDAPK